MIVNLEKFIAEERPRWERLDAMLRKMAEDPWSQLPLAQARELELLYQRASYVVAVGGTTLSLDSNGIASEVAWSGSGGGVSAYETKPTYQSGWQSTTARTVPDVSYNANPSTGFPVYITNYNGSTGWITVGGTSAGSPQWAALQALVNSSRTSALSGVLTAIYGVAGSAYSTSFYDITIGNNGGYTTTISYDFVTGLGSPNAAALVPALIAK